MASRGKTGFINMTISILDIEPAKYQQHAIHTKERDWAETNCYTDVWIEQLHALGFEPIAAMAFTIAIDFEGDQWTFFKFPLNDLYELYGIEVQELVIWKSLATHIEEQINLGRPVLVELDSMYLPDTAGTAYQMEHVKSTISVNSINIKEKKLGYFHAQSYYQLCGSDFDQVFRLTPEFNDSYLEPYVEIAKLDRKPKMKNDDLVTKSIQLLKLQLAKLPKTNPFHIFKKQLEKDIEWLKSENIEMFHQYSFATLRQFGACFEMASVYISWLADKGENDIEKAGTLYKGISEAAKIYQFQLARVVARGKVIELSAIDDMGNMWQKAKDILEKKYLIN